jgi:hypothetical protein
MDFEDIDIMGIVFSIIGFGVGVIVAKQMEAGVIMRVMSGLVSAVACYFIGGKIVNSD